MDMTLILADYAAAENGKLTVVGAGWTICSPAARHGLGLLIETGWGEANQPHVLTLDLVDADGQPFVDPAGQPVHFEINFEVGRPPGYPIGASMSNAVALNVAIPLAAGNRYEWVASIDGTSNASWRRSFTVQPVPLQQAG